MPDRQHNPVHWFEIPVTDMERAMKFYKQVLGYSFERKKMDDMEIAFFPSKMEAWGCGGMLVRHKKSQPSSTGTLIYFASPSGDLENELKKVEKAGGKICLPKTSIKEYGFMGIFADTEGNSLGLQSMK